MTGVILAGGFDRRMEGQIKGLLHFGDELLIVRQLRLMKPVCNELIVVTNEPKPYFRLLDTEIRIITDFVPNRGPLGGMYAGLSLARNRDVWIVGCHMPFLSAQAAELLQTKKHEGFDAALPWVQGRVYPLHGVYDRSCAEAVWRLLQSGDPAVSRVLKEISWGELRETEFQTEGIESSFIDCFNTPEEYAGLLVRRH
ncbi:molybdenum cofactor guanylyltransferase [Paenibacillus sp. HJGM_3]|uniref:molybdenum cofactor guanylyltransferase n=1 Tax=Paenibacillus sp. HJGM_3 TaxID=3379816 RepID=UPI00385DFA3D